MVSHLVIPDTQAKVGAPTKHLEWIGRYILDRRPDVVVHLGDHWECSIELVETEGPWAVMRSDQGPKLVQCERCLFRVPEADMEDSCVCVDCAAYD